MDFVFFAMAHIDNNIIMIISLLGNDAKEIIRHVDQDLFVEMFVIGIFLAKALDFHKVYISQDLCKFPNPMIAYNFPSKMQN